MGMDGSRGRVAASRVLPRLRAPTHSQSARMSGAPRRSRRRAIATDPSTFALYSSEREPATRAPSEKSKREPGKISVLPAVHPIVVDERPPSANRPPRLLRRGLCRRAFSAPELPTKPLHNLHDDRDQSQSQGLLRDFRKDDQKKMSHSSVIKRKKKFGQIPHKQRLP
jgi:hypothetical protein